MYCYACSQRFRDINVFKCFTLKKVCQGNGSSSSTAAASFDGKCQSRILIFLFASSHRFRAAATTAAAAATTTAAAAAAAGVCKF